MIAAVCFDMPLLFVFDVELNTVGVASGSPTKFDNVQRLERFQ